MKCDHSDGTHVGTCAVCGDPVCSECFQSLFNVVICSNHEGLEDESDWELIALYSSSDGSDNLRFFLDDQGLASVAVENEEGTMEVYVPIEQKDCVGLARGRRSWRRHGEVQRGCCFARDRGMPDLRRGSGRGADAGHQGDLITGGTV
jgi:hypothetical protein